MLRTLVFAILIAVPGLAAAEDFPHAVVGSEVHADNGVVVGRVTAVQRDHHGRIISVEIPGGEPPDAASVLPRMVAQNDDRSALRVLASDRRAHYEESGSAERARLR